jgi:RHS repeat-associated protein
MIDDERPKSHGSTAAMAPARLDAATAGMRADRDEATGAREPMLALPTLAPPEGGGAIRGIDAQFRMNPATGTASLQIPIAVSPGRSGFQLGVSLSYDSGAGNGPFGVGWQLSAPSVTRKTDKRLPRHDESDVFVLSGAEDLVPTEEERLSDGFLIRRYRPRVEDTFARIEQWRDGASGEVHWRTTSRDNVTSVFGLSPSARIVDPHDPIRVHSWLLEETRDDRGNITLYEYKGEDGAGVDRAHVAEAHRFDRETFVATAQCYLKRIRYGNRRPEDPSEFLFEVVFDYGEHEREPQEVRAWGLREDPFSTYRAGFEIRTYRLCRRILVFHRFDELGDQPYLVRSTDFTYESQAHLTRLVRVEHAGYEGEQRDTLPPADFRFTPRVLHREVRRIDRASLEGIPGAVDGVTAQWVDLDGEGIPGVLLENERGWYYKSNLGDGRLAPPALLRSLPTPAMMRGGTQQLVDLDGDGRLELASYAPSLPGYFARTAEGGWEPFVTFEDVPNLDWRDRNIRFIDLDGDGRSDVLVTEENAFVWYGSRGREGFEPPLFATRPKDETHGAAVVFNNAEETILLADMSGDGLVDLVRVRNGEVCYWPNLGYGGFGRKITLANSPQFDAAHRFTAARVRLADVDGSGTSDIVYLGNDGVSIYFNESGNRLTDAATLDLPLPHPLASVSVIDLLGRGTACIVWSSTAPADLPRPILYVDLMGGRKPHLLESFANNFGGETTLVYESSTRDYLRDKAAEQPWITRLPFPVHVVSRIEQRDHIAKTKLVSRYQYHHGFYDGVEREYRGFAYVEQWDAETFAGPHELVRPPVRTRTWFHTGAPRERLEEQLAREFYRGDAEAVPLAPTPLPDGLTDVERLQAARALRGRTLRQEIYADDDTPQSAHPYSVSETNYTIRLLQHARDEQRAVFFVHIREQQDSAYERNPRDPRVSRRLVLAVDDYGNTTCEQLTAYPRRRPREPEQGRALSTLKAATFANVTEPGAWRLGIALDSTVREGSRLISRQRHFYSNDDLALALPSEVQRQAFTEELLAEVHGDTVGVELLEAGGYRFDEGVWWVPSNRLLYDRGVFHQPVEAIDPFGNRSTVRYDHYALQVVEAADALGNVSRADVDYRVLAPSLFIDPNGNQSATGFDVLGMPARTAVMGKPASGEGDTLDDPTTIVDYDLHRFETRGLPLVVRSRARERHGEANPRFQETYTYVDGSSREAMRKVQAEPGPSGMRRWIGTGRTIFDNKGNPVRKYEPFFSETFEFEDERELVESGVTPILHYDSLGRLVRTDLPNGALQRIELGPWEKAMHDENDTVLESVWYQERGAPDPRGPEPSGARRRAAWLAAQHAGTPSREHFDPLGRAFLSEEDNGDPRGPFRLRRELDISGNTLAVVDARGVRTIDGQRFDFLQRLMVTESPDSGRARTFADAGGNPLRSWNARGFVVGYEYDGLRRVSRISVDGAVISSIEYGESVPDAAARNLRTRPHRTWDSAGLLINYEFDFKGNPTRTFRRLAKEYRRTPDWSTLDESALEEQTFAASTAYDALNRVVSAIAPDGSETRPAYNEANLLERLETRLRGGGEWTITVANIDYDARGQRTLFETGNGVVTKYDYERETFRLLRQVARRGDGTRLQDDSYEYDPIGNVVAIFDGVSFGNERVRGDAAYVYDPLYRLVSATGREHPGQSGVPELPGGELAHPHDLQRLRRYRERYVYDPTGNIAEVRHELSGGEAGHRRVYDYEEGSNRLVRTHNTSANAPIERYTYDAAGNTTSMPHLGELRWDHADQLVSVNRGGGGEVWFVYDGGGARVRKVCEHAGLIEERIYLGVFEIYRKRRGDELLLERETLHLMDGRSRVALAETKTSDPASVPRLRYQLENQLGSSVFELDGSGNVIAYEQFLPFGGSAVRAFGALLDADRRRYRYTGKERDEETGLDYYGARYYASWLGRWLSVDPSLQSGAGNDRLDQPYVYVRNRPIIANDPDGRVIWFLVAAIVIVGTATAISPANAPTSAEEAKMAQPAISDAEFLIHMTVTGLSFAAGGGATKAVLERTGSKVLAGLAGGAASGTSVPATMVVHDSFRGKFHSPLEYGIATGLGIGGGALLGGLLGLGSRALFGPAKPPVNGGWFGRSAAPAVASQADDAAAAASREGWEKFLPEAEKRLAESYARYGGRGVYASAGRLRPEQIAGAKRFPNQLAGDLPAELELAERLGVEPVRGGTQAFDKLIAEQETIKFVVTESGELLVGPHTVAGEQISHAVLSGGADVIAAGQAQIAKGAGQYFGISITRHSGHFKPSAATLDLAKKAFATLGITFP